MKIEGRNQLKSLSLALIRCALGFEGFFLSDQGLDCNWTHQNGGKVIKG